jgi:hypothetical protein
VSQGLIAFANRIFPLCDVGRNADCMEIRLHSQPRILNSLRVYDDKIISRKIRY